MVTVGIVEFRLLGRQPRFQLLILLLEFGRSGTVVFDHLVEFGRAALFGLELRRLSFQIGLRRSMLVGQKSIFLYGDLNLLGKSLDLGTRAAARVRLAVLGELIEQLSEHSIPIGLSSLGQ